MKFDIRVAFAALALALGSCQGLDSGGMGGGGMMGPPVSQPGPMGTGGDMQGPTIGANGQAELTQPGATLAPNQTQFAVADGPSGVKCPVVTLFGCTVSFNIPTPAPAASGATPTPKPTPTPTPTPSPSASDDSDDNSDSGDTNASPTPPGTITLQMEPLPKDVPAMTNPDPRALRVTPAGCHPASKRHRLFAQRHGCRKLHDTAAASLGPLVCHPALQRSGAARQTHRSVSRHVYEVNGRRHDDPVQLHDPARYRETRPNLAARALRDAVPAGNDANAVAEPGRVGNSVAEPVARAQFVVTARR